MNNQNTKLRMLLAFALLLLSSAISSAEPKHSDDFPTKHLYPRVVLNAAQDGPSKILASLDFYYKDRRVSNKLSLMIDSDSVEPAVDGQCSGHMGSCEKQKIVKAEVLDDGFIKEFFGEKANVIGVTGMLYMSDGYYTHLLTLIDIEGAGLPFEPITRVSIAIPVDASPYWTTFGGRDEASWIQLVPRALNDINFVLRQQGYYPEPPAFSVSFRGVVDEAGKVMASSLSVAGKISTTKARIVNNKLDMKNLATLPLEDFEFKLVKRPIKSQSKVGFDFEGRF